MIITRDISLFYTWWHSSGLHCYMCKMQRHINLDWIIDNKLLNILAYGYTRQILLQSYLNSKLNHEELLASSVPIVFLLIFLFCVPIGFWFYFSVPCIFSHVFIFHAYFLPFHVQFPFSLSMSTLQTCVLA